MPTAATFLWICASFCMQLAWGSSAPLAREAPVAPIKKLPPCGNVRRLSAAGLDPQTPRKCIEKKRRGGGRLLNSWVQDEIRDTDVHDWPLVSVMMLTTADRKEYLKLALRLVLQQSYPNIEVIVVDDSATGPLDTSTLPLLQHPMVKYHHMPQHMSIGAKRNVAVERSKGDVLIHWDDDDLFSPDRVLHQVQPILDGDADMTVLSLRYVAWVGSNRIDFFDYNSSYVFDGSIAFRRSVWGGEVTYPNASLAEDLYFGDQALRKCACLKILEGVDGVYVRHVTGGNTWQWNHSDVGQHTQGPKFVTPELEQAVLQVESNYAHQDRREVVNLWHGHGLLSLPLFWPNFMPAKCFPDLREEVQNSTVPKPRGGIFLPERCPSSVIVSDASSSVV